MNLRDIVVFYNRIYVRHVNNMMARVTVQITPAGTCALPEGAQQMVSQKCFPEYCHTVRIESIVRDEIDAFFGGFIHNKVLKGASGFHRKQIDHRLHIGNTILAIETDEHGHVSYKQENERYQDFMRNFSYKFVFIRFNPHSNMEYSTEKTDFKRKLHVLMDYIETHIERIEKGQNVWKLEIVRLFYGARVQYYAMSQ